MKLFYLFCLLCLNKNAMSQAIYDSKGQYLGYQQISPNGVTNNYNAVGQNIGSSQIDNGQTNYYSPNGKFQGTTTAIPTAAIPNTSINSPRQAPQAPIMKGW